MFYNKVQQNKYLKCNKINQSYSYLNLNVFIAYIKLRFLLIKNVILMIL